MNDEEILKQYIMPNGNIIHAGILCAMLKARQDERDKLKLLLQEASQLLVCLRGGFEKEPCSCEGCHLKREIKQEVFADLDCIFNRLEGEIDTQEYDRIKKKHGVKE